MHENDRLSTITKAEQYLQVRAFAKRYAITRLFAFLQGVRDRVKENDPFGFMKILTDEAVSHCQSREIETRIGSLISKLQNQFLDDQQLITDSTWNTTNQALTSANLSVIRPRSKAPTTFRGAKLSSDTQLIISQSVSEVLAEVQKLYDTQEGQEKARSRFYKSDEMKETVLALQYHFYITSENHFPARWSSYGETTYSNNVVESDTPARALPTQVAQAMGIPFYRAFTFSLDDALIQQNFRSGYTRAPQDSPPFHQEHQLTTNQSAQYNGRVVEPSPEPAGDSDGPHVPATLPEEPTSPIAPEALTQEQHGTAESCAAPYQRHTDEDQQNAREQDTTFRRPISPSGFKSPPCPVNNRPSPFLAQYTIPPSTDATCDMPPPMTQTQRKLGKKSTTDEVKREDENDLPSAFDRRDDQFDEGIQLWLDIWKGIEEYLPAGERQLNLPNHAPHVLKKAASFTQNWQ